MAGPVDPLANPTRVVRLLRDHPLCLVSRPVIGRVPRGRPGRRAARLSRLHSASGAYGLFHPALTWRLELYEKTTQGRRADSRAFPFLDLYASIMDLPATYFLENTELVFHERAAWTGASHGTASPSISAPSAALP